MFAAILSVFGAAICLVLGLVFPWMKVPIIIGLCYGLAALGVTVLMRAGQVSFGHAMYSCIAGYTAAFLARAYPGMDGLLLIAAGVLASLAAGAVIGLFVVRYREIFFGMLNLALSMVFYSVLGKFYEITGGTDGLRLERAPIAGFKFDRTGYETALLVTALSASLLLGWLVQRYFGSASGEALAGIKTNETRLEYLGMSARRILWYGYMISAGLCGLAGALFVLLQGLVTPELGYWVRSGEFVFIAILGGAAHALGAFIGAVVFQAIQLVGTVLVPGTWKMLLGATLIIVILVAPTGITGVLPIKGWSKPRERKLALRPVAEKS
jgi:ABC-type branched-subunit amino acid transport system permease subunit